jgi:hypothetical protein
MYKIVKIVLIVLGLIGVILWFQLPDSDMPATQAIGSTSINFMFIITYILMAIAIFFSLVFSLINLFANPRNLKKTLFMVVGFLLVLAISYGLASGTDVNIDEMAARGISTSETVVKRIGMGLNMFFILVIIAVGAMIWGGVRKMTN